MYAPFYRALYKIALRKIVFMEALDLNIDKLRVLKLI